MKGCPSGCRHDPGTACRPGQGYQPLGKRSRRTRRADRQENSAGIGVQHGRACLMTHEKELELQKNPAAALFGLLRGESFPALQSTANLPVESILARSRDFAED